MLTKNDMRTLIDDKKERIAELEAEVERLRELVKEAYVEGWRDGYVSMDYPSDFVNDDWEDSDAKAALEPGGE